MAVDPLSGPLFNRLAGKQVLARVAWEEGDEPTAREMLATIVEDAVIHGSVAGLAPAAELTAEIAAARQDPETASRLLDAASEVRARYGLARDPYETDRCESLRAELPEASADGPEHLGDLLREALAELAAS